MIQKFKVFLARRKNKFNPDESNLVQHARYELDIYLGEDDEHDFYQGMTKKALLELIETFASQGHSGMSASITRHLFNLLADFKALTPLTDNPSEWQNVSDFFDDRQTWQNRRQSNAFSNDGGKTYYTLDAPDIVEVAHDHTKPIFEDQLGT